MSRRMQVLNPATALAGTNIILTGKGVKRVAKLGELFDRCPYELLHNQGVLPSTVKVGAPDFIDIVVDAKLGPLMDLSGVYHLDQSVLITTAGGNVLAKLVPVEYVRNAHT